MASLFSRGESPGVGLAPNVQEATTGRLAASERSWGPAHPCNCILSKAGAPAACLPHERHSHVPSWLPPSCVRGRNGSTCACTGSKQQLAWTGCMQSWIQLEQMGDATQTGGCGTTIKTLLQLLTEQRP
jgi:hypothetical protein